MIDTGDDALDVRLREMLAAVHAPSDDDAFVAQVMHRVRRRAMTRRVVLGAAALLGAAVAVAPLAELATMFGAWLGTQANAIRALDAANLSLSSSIVAALTVGFVGAFRWLMR